MIGPWSALPWLIIPAAIMLGLSMLALSNDSGHAGKTGHAVRMPDIHQDPRVIGVLDAVSSPVVLIDHRGNVVHANEAARWVFPGLRHGHPLAFVLRAPAMVAAVEAVIGGQDEAQAEYSERIPVERRFEVAIRRLVLPGDARRLGDPFAVVIMPETTAAHRLEAMRADFIANASHELRTPLASIIGFIETLQGAARDDAAARKSFLVIMDAQARRMSRLIDDLLSLSRIELSEHVQPSKPVELGGLLGSVCDSLRGLAGDRGVALRLAASETDAIVSGDRDELVRVFENLIENAVKYGQSGGMVDIAIASVLEAGQLAFAVSVRDYGPGVASEHLPRLTERFYRADVNESRVMGGTGLGLAIVKHIVTRHRGRLQIESQIGQGATFTVILPSEKI